MKTIKWIAGLIVLAVLGALIWMSAQAKAADLGGTCCADLEERIAELEATSAKKGNRKISLTITGQVDAGLSWVSIGDFDKTQVMQNGNDRSFVGFMGKAQINKDMSAGYKIEIDLAQLGLLGSPVLGTSPQTGVRQSYWFLKSESIGTVAVGKQSLATNDFDKWSTNTSWLAGKPLSLGSLSDLYLSGIDVPFDGDYLNGYRNVVRYDSPTVQGFTISATWGNSFDATKSDGNGNAFDVAVRYAAELKEWLFKAAVGYRRSTDLQVNLVGLANLTIPTGDVDTFLATGSVMNVPTGIFVNVNYAHQDYNDLNFNLQGVDVTAGLHRKVFDVGPSELFGTWGQYKIDAGGSTDINYWGMGATQNLNDVMTLYVGWRHYDTNDILGDNVDVVNGGAVIPF